LKKGGGGGCSCRKGKEEQENCLALIGEGGRDSPVFSLGCARKKSFPFQKGKRKKPIAGEFSEQSKEKRKTFRSYGEGGLGTRGERKGQLLHHKGGRG